MLVVIKKIIQGKLRGKKFLGEMLTIAVFPQKRHQFHDANFF